MIFFQLNRYGDFDIPITDSMWYKENTTDQELTFLKDGTLLNKMIAEFSKSRPGMKFKINNTSIYCGRAERKILGTFKEYLKSKGFKVISVDMRLQFTDENWEDMGD